MGEETDSKDVVEGEIVKSGDSLNVAFEKKEKYKINT